MEKNEMKKRYPGLDEKGLEIALARHAAVSWIEVQHKQGETLEACYRSGSEMEWRGRRFGESTLERYWCWYRRDGFEALLPKERVDVGQSRVLSADFLKRLEERRRAQPQQTVKELLRSMLREGQMERLQWGSLSSIYRYLRRVGLDGKSLQRAGSPGPTKAFTVLTANELWMTDVMFGPVLVTATGEKIATRLIAIIDDASRLIAYAEYRAWEKEEDFWVVLMEAMERRGVPQKLYTDNGKIFTSLRTQATCARLGIRLLHAKPYAAWSKGKIERWFLTVQTQFESRLEREPVRELAALNLKFWHWVEAEYHQREHSSLQKSPQARFWEDAGCVRLLEREKLEGCFWQEEKRRVRRDATVAWQGQSWEVPVFLRGLKVTLRYNPLQKNAPVEVWHDRKQCGQLQKLDRQLNARTFSPRQAYE
jgi:putative transposase